MKHLVIGNGRNGTILGKFASCDRLHDEIFTVNMSNTLTVLVSNIETVYIDSSNIISSNIIDAKRDGAKFTFVVDGIHHRYTTFNKQLIRKLRINNKYDLRIDIHTNINGKPFPVVKSTVHQKDEIEEEYDRRFKYLTPIEEYMKL